MQLVHGPLAILLDQINDFYFVDGHRQDGFTLKFKGGVELRGSRDEGERLMRLLSRVLGPGALYDQQA